MNESRLVDEFTFLAPESVSCSSSDVVITGKYTEIRPIEV